MMSLEKRFNTLLNEIQRKEPSYVKIAVIGQPGAGKSTLINNLVGKPVAETGVGTDTTRKEEAYDYNFQKIVDLPGYGTKMFTFPEWSKEFAPNKYDVFLCVFKGKLHEDDEKLFLDLEKFSQERQRVFFLIRTHSEALSEPEKDSVRSDIISKSLNVFDSVYFVELGRNKLGIDDLKSAIRKTDFNIIWKGRINNAFIKARDSYLKKAESSANDSIDSYSKAASLNGINPLPGVDVAVDIGIYMKMFSSIRNEYDIENDDLSQYALPVAKKLLELMTKEGVMILLKNFASKTAAKSVLKYIPFFGQVTAATLGYKMAHSAGENYNKDCYQMSKEVMDKLIKEKMVGLKNISN